MATWKHGYCIAKCIICHRPVLYFSTLSQHINSNWNQYDPFTSIKRHYRQFHPDEFSILFRDMKRNGGDPLRVTFQ
jgi:hypothetical protein